MPFIDQSIMNTDFLSDNRALGTNFSLFAYMLFPDDVYSREEFLTSLKSSLLTRSGLLEELSLPADVYEHLLERTKIAPNEKEGVSSFKEGLLAGLMVLNLLCLTTSRNPPSINKAIFLTMQDLELAKKRAFFTEASETKKGIKFPRSNSALRAIWSRYAPVSHFWGAWVLLRHQARSLEQEFIYLEELSPLASVGEGIRAQLESIHASQHAPSPNLDPKIFFKLPEHLEVEPAKISISALSPTTDAFLQEHFRT